MQNVQNCASVIVNRKEDLLFVCIDEFLTIC